MGDLNELYETLGQLAEAVKTLQAGQTYLRESLQRIQETLSEARGGWRVLMWIGGSAAAAGLAIGTFFDHLIAFFHRSPS